MSRMITRGRILRVPVKTTSVRQSQDLAAALKAAGVPHILQIYQGQGHGGPRFHDEAARKLMAGFLEKHAAPAAQARSTKH